MVGRMLLGAWLLMHQQCCSATPYGNSISGPKSLALVDPLTRRSPLEKNFMRFGRSGPSLFLSDFGTDEKPGRFSRASPDVPDASPSRRIKAKRMSTPQTGQDLSEDRSKRNGGFMRFGRKGFDPRDDSKESTESTSVSSEDEVGAAKNREGDSKPLLRDELNFHDCGETNYQRGTQDDSLTRLFRGNEKFMRFWKKRVNGDDEVPVRALRDRDDIVRTSRQRQQDNGYIRFGRGDRRKRETRHKEKDGETACRELAINRCPDGNCKSFRMHWPIYYQPTLYGFLPNLLTSASHKSKRAKAKFHPS